MKRPLIAGAAILVAWMLLDLIAHRFFLAPIYEANASLWRPFDQMNIVLIYAVTVVLIGVFVAIYALLVKPKSLGAVWPSGLCWPRLGNLFGVWHVHSHADSACPGLGLVHRRWLKGLVAAESSGR